MSVSSRLKSSDCIFYFWEVQALENRFFKKGNLRLMGKFSALVYIFGGIRKNFIRKERSIGFISGEICSGWYFDSPLIHITYKVYTSESALINSSIKLDLYRTGIKQQFLER